MTPREKLQLSYELAFFPPRLNQVAEIIRQDAGQLQPEWLDRLDEAALLHLALPEKGYASSRALERLAIYQARSRAYGMPGFLRAIRHRLGRSDLPDTFVPGHLVRDIALPEFCRSHQPPTNNPQPPTTP
jgi:hypothetical protein